MSAAKTAAAILMLTFITVSCRTAGTGLAGREPFVLWPGAWAFHDWGGDGKWTLGLGLTLGNDDAVDREVTIKLHYEDVGRAKRVRKLVVEERSFGHPTVEREVTSADDIERVTSILLAAATTDLYRYYERGERNVIQGFGEFCFRPPRSESPEEARRAGKFFEERYLRHEQLTSKASPETIRNTARDMLGILEAELAVGWMSP